MRNVVVGVCALAVVVGVAVGAFLWGSGAGAVGRYQMTDSGTMMLNTTTGEVYFIQNDGKGVLRWRYSVPAPPRRQTLDEIYGKPSGR